MIFYYRLLSCSLIPSSIQSSAMRRFLPFALLVLVACSKTAATETPLEVRLERSESSVKAESVPVEVQRAVYALSGVRYGQRQMLGHAVGIHHQGMLVSAVQLDGSEKQLSIARVAVDGSTICDSLVKVVKPKTDTDFLILKTVAPLKADCTPSLSFVQDWAKFSSLPLSSLFLPVSSTVTLVGYDQQILSLQKSEIVSDDGTSISIRLPSPAFTPLFALDDAGAIVAISAQQKAFDVVVMIPAAVIEKAGK